MKAPNSISASEKLLAELRERMVDEQLRQRRIRDEQVLAAMTAVPRHQFVPPSQFTEAYEDKPLTIGHGQTISQPYTVAFMCECLRLRPEETVLEVGTGSGYGTALLSRLARQVYSVDRIPELVEQASERLARLHYDNVELRVANGTLGLPDAAPFDAIVVTAGGDVLPEDYRHQLKPEGRIVIPLGAYPASQRLNRFTQHDDRLESEDLGPFAFVPLIGTHGWSQEQAEGEY